MIGVEIGFLPLFFIFHLACIAKPSNFDHFILEEEAGRFESAMDVLLLCEKQEPRYCIFEVDQCLALRDFSPSGHAIVQIPLVAELGDDVAVIDGGVDIEAVDEIGVLQFLQDLYLAVELVVPSVLAAQVDDLDGYLFGGLFVEAFEGVGFVA